MRDHEANSKNIMKNNTSSNHPLADVEIPGLKQLFDKSYTPKRKIFWGFMVVLCLVISIYHMVNLSIQFFTHPVVVDISILRNDSITFPGITICPLRLFKRFSEELDHLLRTECTNKGINFFDCDVSTFPENGDFLEILWRKNSFEYERDFEITSACTHSSNILIADRSYPDCIDGRMVYKMDYSYSKTLFGNCLTLMQRNPMPFKGPGTFIKFKEKDRMFTLPGRQRDEMDFQSFDEDLNFQEANIRDEDLNTSLLNMTDLTEFLDSLHMHSSIPAESHFSEISSFSIFFHPPGVFSVHEVPFMSENVYASYSTVIRCSVREFRYLNTRKNPCTSEDTYIRCRNKCNNERLQKILPCRLPFAITPKLPGCKNRSEAIDAYMKATEYYRHVKLSDCHCKRKCKDFLYFFTTDVMFQSHDSMTRINLYYPNNVHEIITEKHAYKLANFLSDIGGTLSFCLGLCLLSIVGVFERWVFKKISEKN